MGLLGDRPVIAEVKWEISGQLGNIRFKAKWTHRRCSVRHLMLCSLCVIQGCLPMPLLHIMARGRYPETT